MNKQEAIEEIKKHSTQAYDDFAIFRDTAIHIVNQIYEPKKPVVPQYVADWYEVNKDDFENNLFMYSRSWKRQDKSSFARWFSFNDNEPIQTLVNMHQFGYEVEKEKLYTARFKASKEYLNFDKNYKELHLFRVPKDVAERCDDYHFAKEKLIEYAIWDNPAFEIEEVEDD